MRVRCSSDFIGLHAVPHPSTARIGQFNVRAARLPARQRSRQLFAPDSFRLVKQFSPSRPRTGQAALLASAASHGRKPFSPQTAFTGSLLSAPTNPGDIAASPDSGWSHNSSFKPTPHRGVNSVLYATLHAVAAPLRVGLTQALGGRKAFGCFAFQRSFSWLRLALLFGRFHAALLLRSSPLGAQTLRMRCVDRLRRQ